MKALVLKPIFIQLFLCLLLVFYIFIVEAYVRETSSCDVAVSHAGRLAFSSPLAAALYCIHHSSARRFDGRVVNLAEEFSRRPPFACSFYGSRLQRSRTSAAVSRVFFSPSLPAPSYSDVTHSITMPLKLALRSPLGYPIDETRWRASRV